MDFVDSSTPEASVEDSAGVVITSSYQQQQHAKLEFPICGECNSEICVPGMDCRDCNPEEIAPVDRVVIPSDVVDISDDLEVVFILGTRGTKVTRIDGLSRIPRLRELILRSCLISSMDGVEDLVQLRKLELYDNQIGGITRLDRLTNLTILDLSFNAIREMSAVQCCPNLEELYIAQNKLRRIEGLEAMSSLRILDLGANRLRVSGIATLCTLCSYFDTFVGTFDRNR